MVPPCRSTAAPSHLVPGLILGGPLPRAPGVIRAASPSPRASAGHASTQRDNDDDRQQHHIPVHRTLRAPQRLLGPEGARASSHLRRGYRCFSTSRCFVPAKVTGPAGITTFSRAPRPGNARRPGIGDVSPWQDGAHLIHRRVHQIQLDALQAVRRAVTDGARSEAEAIQRLERSPSGAQTHHACHQGQGQGRYTTRHAKVLARSLSPLSSQRQWLSPCIRLLSPKAQAHCPRVLHQNGLSKAYGPWE